MIAHYRKFQWFYLTFLTIVFFGLGSYYFIHFGYYPVAIVNSKLITAKALNEEYVVAYRYYAGAALLAGKVEEIGKPEFKKELRRATLNDLIEKVFISGELQKRIGEDLGGIVQNKISASVSDTDNLEEAAQSLYGLSLADFQEMVLVPQAKREILEGRLFLEKKELGGWLVEAASNAKVFILTPEFYWDINKVALRE